MRIGINAAWLDTPSSGIKTYVRNIIHGLVGADHENDYVLYSKTPLPASELAGIAHLQRIVTQPAGRRLRIPFNTSLALARARIDVVHEQIMAPAVFPARIVVSVHDTLHEHFPEFYEPSVLRRMRTLMPITMRRAAAIITDSEFSKRDIVRLYHVPDEKVTVAYLAAGAMFRPLHDDIRLTQVRARYGLGDHYILFVGALKRTKNLKTVLDAYIRLRRADSIRHRLVLVGNKALLVDDIFAEARASGYADDIIFTGRVPDDDLVALYNAADLFVHPSLFEGFGLPVLEAMACGVPVVTSNTTAMPEVVGDAAMMIDPLDVEALAKTIRTALHDEPLLARLSAQGLERAAAFSWDATTRTILQVYGRVADKGRL